MKTILFIRDVIERLPQKTTYVKAIASVFNQTINSVTDKKTFDYNETRISIGGSDSLGRCNINSLSAMLNEADIIIMPAIGGPVEHSVITKKSMITNEDYDVLIITPPQIRKSSTLTDEDISDIFGCYVKKIVDFIIQK